MEAKNSQNAPALEIKGLRKEYGDFVLEGMDLTIERGKIMGLVGENGAGKSSLFKIFAGIDKDYTGETQLLPGYSMGYLEQEPYLEPGKTVLEVVKEGVKPITDLLEEFDKINEAFGEPDADIDKLCARQGEVQEKLDALDAWNLDNNLELAMDALRCPPSDQIVDVLSGGERRRVALCRLLLQKPDILLLDEPTNHLDAETVAWLEKHLHDYPGTVIAITHDRYFLDEVAGWILELDRGEGFPFKGNYSFFLKIKAKLLVKKKFSGNLTGFTRVQKVVRQNIKSILHAITNLCRRVQKFS